METYRIAVKVFAEGNPPVEGWDFVRVFHGWIQRKALGGHMLVDVTDYDHVPEGPGTVLIAHEANLHADRTGGRLGLLYVRKQPIEGAGLKGKVEAVLREAMGAAKLLEGEETFGGRLRFGTGEVLVRINDRLAGPNTAATFAAVRGEIEGAVGAVLGRGVRAVYGGEGEGPFEVVVG